MSLLKGFVGHTKCADSFIFCTLQYDTVQVTKMSKKTSLF